MKKLMVIAAAVLFLFTGCAKVDITPDSKRAALSQADLIPLPEVNAYYIITNTETDWGIVEYRVEYIDCNGDVQNVPLLMKESITVCLKYGVATTNFAHTIVLAK